ncbi:MAG: hypothetical protein KatS3mg057_1178 [Herpetosiphonaceae bacterium]|nr:MAG: hypothetical protein KatS3mg057_1178 [Herpetosiphonaceae bacterium]
MSDVAAALAAGIAAVQAGKREEARRLLLQVVQLDEYNEQAWLWLSSVVDSIDDAITCLENVLTINAQNEWAREALEVMRVRQILAAGPASLPTSTVQTSGVARRLGEYLVEQGYLHASQLRHALNEQQTLRRQGQHIPLGEILLRNHLISRDQLAYALESQFLSGGAAHAGAISQLGDYLIRKGYITWSQLAQIIALQADLAQQGRRMRLGELLVHNQLLTPEQLTKALEEQFQDFDTQFGSRHD